MHSIIMYSLFILNMPAYPIDPVHMGANVMTRISSQPVELMVSITFLHVMLGVPTIPVLK